MADALCKRCPAAAAQIYYSLSPAVQVPFSQRHAMNDFDLLKRHANRRTFLGRSVTGLGAFALSSMLAKVHAAPKFVSKGAVQPLHFEPKVKRVIFLTMAGGPSHLETFDHKPKLAAMDGKPMPESFTKG